MSRNFEKVKTHYDEGRWVKKKVRDAVGKWITAEEYKMITGEEFSEE